MQLFVSFGWFSGATPNPPCVPGEGHQPPEQSHTLSSGRWLPAERAARGGTGVQGG